MRRALVVAGITVAHFVLSVGLFLTEFGMGMARFDTGAEASIGERVFGVVVSVLHSPVVTVGLAVIPARALPRLWGYVPFMLNSLLWGFALTALLARLRSPSGRSA